MPARSAVKRPDPVTVKVPIGEGEAVTVVFNRNAMTQNWAKRLQAGMASENIGSASSALVEILMQWDIVEDDGSPTPLSAEVLADLPLSFLQKLDEAIGQAGTPTSEEGNGSSVTSSTPMPSSTQQPASPQNGPQPSSLPAPSISPSPT